MHSWYVHYEFRDTDHSVINRMEAIGAAATIIGLVQAGLSLAKALNTYAGTVHDANDDIAVLADDVYSTYRHLNDLDLVLKKNEKAEVLTADALESAQKCIRQAEILIRKLKKLLIKGYGSDDAGEIIESKQIDISKFKKGIWYIYKSEFELRRSELAQIKADISLIYLTYLALSANSTTERKQAQDEMELVYNRKIVLNRKVKKAREQRDRDVEEGAMDEDRDGVEGETNGTDGVYEYPPDLEDTAIVYDNVEALYREFENWLAQREQKAAALAAERKKLEEDVIARHEDAVKEEARKVQAEAQKLRDALLRHGVPPQRVLDISGDVYPRSTAPVVTDKHVALGGTGESIASDPFGKGISGKADAGSLLDPLRDLNEPGGIAQLKAFYLQRVYASPTRSEILKLEVAVSGQQLLQKRSVSSGNIGATLGTDASERFGGIPEDYMFQVRSELETLQSELGQTWILLQAEPVRKRGDSRRFRLGRRKKTDDEVIGVQIVIRKVTERNGLWQPGGDKTVETVSARAQPTPPEVVVASMPVHSETREAADRMYYPRHATQIIPRGATANYSSDGTRMRIPIERRRRAYDRSPDSSPERESSQRRTRFAPQVTTIPSPRYDDSTSDGSKGRWDFEASPYRSSVRIYPDFSSQSVPRRESISSVEGSHYAASRRSSRGRPFNRQFASEWGSDTESDSGRPIRNRVTVRPHSAATSYAIPRRRPRTVTSLGRPPMNRSKVSSDLSEDEAETTVLQASPELPSDVAVHSILKRWGTCTVETSRDFDTGMGTSNSGPLSRRSTFDVSGKYSHTDNGTGVSFNSVVVNGSS